MKKYIVLLACIFVVSIAGIVGISMVSTNEAKEYFASSGYVLGSSVQDKVSFTEQTAFKATSTGSVQFQDETGTTTSMSDDTFVHLNDGSIMALSDGILLDFDDLSSNFINNYYTTRTFSISETGSNYTAETESASITFGEHLWKLSDNKYLIRSSTLTVHFSDTDVRTATDYVEISVTDDGIVQILTETDVWMTISESCYVETAGGVTINPITKIIDDGTYKITINKLVVSPDDSIVLTADETRFQIVPEFNIETIDGEDGEDGEIGEDGEAGQAGDAGENGEDGEDGEDGGSGVVGASGSDGEEGASGDSGTSGANGDGGTSGDEGDGGDGGDGGVSGSNGTKGVDATVSSSLNTALPTMTIGDWNVTSTSLQATILVGGGIETLDLSALSSTSTDAYAGKISITNVATGEVVYGYQTEWLNDTYVEPDDTAYLVDFTSAVDVYFTTYDPDSSTSFDINTLQPDTQYVLSVSAYYLINDTIYYREFISRTFYTDSTGVQMLHESSTVDSATVTTIKSDENSEVTIYLLTVAQNESFSLAAASMAASAGAYTASASLSDWDDNLSTSTTFTGLSADTQYIVRAVVTTDGNSSLISQEETFYTLKTSLSGVGESEPTAYYNRVSGAVEVYLPTDIVDADDGITQYVYSIYNDDGVLVTTKTLSVSDVQPATFYLSNDVYYAVVEAYFDDNEKVAIYNLGTSNSVTLEGTTLPKVTWADSASGSGTTIQYNAVSGTIRIDLTNGATIDFTDNKGITLNIYADQIIDLSVSLDVNNPEANEDDSYSISYTSGTNYVDIAVDLENLYNNTNYSFTVGAYVDLGDGNGAIYRTLGYVTATTYKTNTLNATYASVDDSNSISVMMSLTSLEDGGSTQAYTEDELTDGSVTVKLYSGTGNSKSLLGTVNYTSDEDLDAIYGDGINITEDTFALPSLNSDSDYTIEVSSVVDSSYNKNLGYENSFTVNNNTSIVVAEETPPDLTKVPASAVTATAITNDQATLYGAVYNEALADDTVIGYCLQSNYDNSQNLATEVTYYLFEYTEFYNALETGNDPVMTNYATRTVNEAAQIDSITIAVASTATTLPSVAVFFTDVTFNSNTVTDGTVKSNGSYVYQPTAEEGETLYYSRGYRYVFAYTAEYKTTALTDTTYIYPYSHSDYTGYKNNYGAGTEMGAEIGLGAAYVLNSGMVSAPKATPEFSTYVNSSKSTADGGLEGSVELYYTFNDIDGAIVTEGSSPTQIVCDDLNGSLSTQSIVGTDIGKDSNGTTWYSVTLPYKLTLVEPEGLLLPIVALDDYVKDYSDIFAALSAKSGYTITEEDYYLTQIPVEIDYEALFNQATYQSAVNIEMDVSNLEKNYITFELTNATTASSTAFEFLMERAYALQLIFSVSDGSTESLTFYSPIVSDGFGGYTVAFATAQISDFLDKTFTVEANVCYDTGMQGWSLLENSTSGMFGLQRTNMFDGSEEYFEFGSYYRYTTTSVGASASKAGGLVTLSSSYSSYTTSDFDTFYKNLQATSAGDSLLTTHFVYVANTSSSLTRYLTVEASGVSDTSTYDVEKVSAYRIVPKGVGSYALSFVGSNSATLTSITPTISSISTNVGIEEIMITSFTISGYTQIKADSDGNYNVTVSVYSTQEDALAQTNVLVSQTVALVGGKFSGSASVEQEDGTWSEDTTITLNGLEEDEQYYYVFSAYVGEDATTQTILQDNETAAEAIYSFETIDGIRITPSDEGAVYYNADYSTKFLQLKFSLNEYQKVEVEYDIYTADQFQTTDSGAYLLNTAGEMQLNLDESNVEVDAYFSYEELKAANILSEPSESYSNTMLISLTPSTAREKLDPGVTYYLRLYAYTGDGDVYDVVFVPFTITAATTPTAFIYADNATSDTISYIVSISDEEHSLMTESSATIATPYMVRFTDASGNLIETVYDDIIYDGATTAQQKFELSYENLAGASATKQEAYLAGTSEDAVLQANTYYTLSVYSLVDLEHDGLSYPIATSTDTTLDADTVQEVSYFWQDTSTAVEWKTFIDLVDSFWYTTTDSSNENTYVQGQNDTSMDLVENNFVIASKTQVTTNTDNFYLANDSAFVTLNTSNMFELVLSESYGIVTADGDQAFEKIQYSMVGTLYSTGGAKYYEGYSYASKDTLFVAGTDSFGYNVFTYVVPTAVEGGKYIITIKLYENEDDLSAYTTLSFTYLT